MNAKELYQAGKLSEAIQAAIGEVKSNPTDLEMRAFLCELLCVQGDLERADKQLETLLKQDPKAAVGVTLIRQLVRAETARRDFFTAGRPPEMLDEDVPTEAMQLCLKASISCREGDTAAAMDYLAQAEEVRPKVSGKCDGKAFDDFRDIDDLCAPFLEVLTSTGKYFWIANERIESIEIHPPQRPIDLQWLRVHMIVKGGPDGEVYLPATYYSEEQEEAAALGRTTEWRGDEGEPIRGVGQRTFLVGEEARPILEIRQIEFDSPVGPNQPADTAEEQ